MSAVNYRRFLQALVLFPLSRFIDLVDHGASDNLSVVLIHFSSPVLCPAVFHNMPDGIPGCINVWDEWAVHVKEYHKAWGQSQRTCTLYLDKCTWRRFLFRVGYIMLLHYSIPLSDNVDNTHGYSLRAKVFWIWELTEA